MRNRFVHTVIRERPQRVDDGYNGTRPDWSLPPDELSIERCAIAPGRSSEHREQGREGVTIKYTVWTNGGRLDVAAGDRLRIPFETDPLGVEGEPSYWENRTGRSGMAIELVDVSG